MEIYRNKSVNVQVTNNCRRNVAHMQAVGGAPRSAVQLPGSACACLFTGWRKIRDRRMNNLDPPPFD